MRSEHYIQVSQWTFSDFIAVGVLLLITGLMLDLVMSKVKKTNLRIAFSVVILSIQLLIWAEFAVSIL